MNKVFGFNDLENKLKTLFNGNNLHHCNIIAGQKGIGKSNFIYNIASFILAHKNDNNTVIDSTVASTFELVKSGSHPDLLVLDINTLDEDNKENISKRGEINVAQVRKTIKGINLTNSMSKYKVIIIDAIDEINTNGQNALLKTLEEPPLNTYIFLICHNLHKVLDTIKSRSNIFHINEINLIDFSQAILLQKNTTELSLSDNEINNLYDFSNGSIATALKILELNAFELYENILTILTNKDISLIQELANKCESNTEYFLLFTLLMDNIFNKLQYLMLGENKISEDYFIYFDKIIQKMNIKILIEYFDYFRNMVNDIDKYNLNKSHCVNVLLNKIAK